MAYIKLNLFTAKLRIHLLFLDLIHLIDLQKTQKLQKSPNKPFF